MASQSHISLLPSDIPDHMHIVSFSGNALGADTYWLAGLHMYTPLPFRPGRGGFGDLFRTHCFVNAGNLRNLDFTDFGK